MSFFDETYTIGRDGSLLVESQASGEIRRATFHDDSEAMQLFENGTVIEDRGDHLRDLKSI